MLPSFNPKSTVLKYFLVETPTSSYSLNFYSVYRSCENG